MRKPPRRIRIDNRKDTISKADLINIMKQLEPEATKKSLGQAYDRVTSAINAWLVSTSKDLPKGLHSRLLLANCFSINLCWLKGKPEKYPDYPYIWMTIGNRDSKLPGPRAYLERLRWDEYKRWVNTGKIDVTP